MVCTQANCAVFYLRRVDDPFLLKCFTVKHLIFKIFSKYFHTEIICAFVLRSLNQNLYFYSRNSFHKYIMAVNKSALLRYNTIDKCLRNRFRKWTLDNLIEKVADALYDQEGIATGISKRTIQADIQQMRSDKLGYNAPIIVVDKKFYTYEDAAYSIHHVAVSDADMVKMKEAVSLLRQLSGFAHFEEMSDVIARLEHSVQYTSASTRTIIQLEYNNLVKGLQWITPLTNAIKEEVPLLITYKSFKAVQAMQKVYYPYLLKEFRNRWFLIGKAKGAKVMVTLALDRIEEMQEMAKKDFVPYDGIDFDTYYADCIGVTKSEKDRAKRIVFWVDKQNVPYITTKPLHASQEVVKEEAGGVIFKMYVVPNFELQKELLGFGEAVKVLGPKILRDQIRKRLKKAADHYFT